MKKLISILLCFCLCIFAIPLLSACNEEDKYWLTTHEKLSAFVETDLSEYTSGFTFSEKIQTNISSDFATYNELKTIYSPIFNVSIGIISDYQNVFSLSPANDNGNTKNALKTLNTEIDNISASLKDFKENAIPTFEARVEGSTQELAESILSVQALKEFKREYVDLSSKLLAFGETLVNAYTKAYQDIPTLFDGENYSQLTTEQLNNYTRLATTKTIIYSLRPTIAYLNSFNGVYKKYTYDIHFDILKDYENMLKNKTADATVEKLHEFNVTYSYYITDVALFEQALEKIDMQKLANQYDFNINEYSEESTQNYANATKVLMFSEYSMFPLKTKLAAMYK